MCKCQRVVPKTVFGMSVVLGLLSLTTASFATTIIHPDNWSFESPGTNTYQVGAITDWTLVTSGLTGAHRPWMALGA